MTVYKDTLQKIWREYNPYYGFPFNLVKSDLQGWISSKHKYLVDTVTKQKPNVIIEIGVWKGASCIELANAVRTNNLDAVVIAVDTWLGSWDHWANIKWRTQLGFEFGYPTIYRIFMKNIIEAGLSDIVIPLPLDSINAWHVLKELKITPQLVHIDGGHDYDTVSRDLHKWWEVLSLGGILIVDDYDETGPWGEARDAVKDFLKTIAFAKFEAESNKCRFIKAKTRRRIKFPD
jgi:predicted O-methyltransferase YrrM